MKLDVRRLRLLYELSLRGTLSATARALDYTPSAVSQQLATLEREAGVRLLERDGRRVVLTPAARRLAARARHIIDELEAASAELHAGRDTVDGEVHLGAFPSAAFALAVPVATALTSRHPGLSLTVREVDPDEGARLLSGGELDLLVAYEYDLLTPIPGAGMERIPLLEDPLVVGISRTHPLSTRPAIGLTELAGEPWIAGLPGTTFGALVQRACRAAGFEPRIAHRAREFALQQALVEASLGVALLPSLACARPRPDIAYLPIHPSTLVRHICALARKGGRQRPALRAVIEELIQHATHPANET